MNVRLLNNFLGKNYFLKHDYFNSFLPEKKTAWRYYLVFLLLFPLVLLCNTFTFFGSLGFASTSKISSSSCSSSYSSASSVFLFGLLLGTKLLRFNQVGLIKYFKIRVAT